MRQPPGARAGDQNDAFELKGPDDRQDIVKTSENRCQQKTEQGRLRAGAVGVGEGTEERVAPAGGSRRGRDRGGHCPRPQPGVLDRVRW